MVGFRWFPLVVRWSSVGRPLVVRWLVSARVRRMPSNSPSPKKMVRFRSFPLLSVGPRWFLPTGTVPGKNCCLPCVSKSGLKTHGFFGSCLLPSRLLLLFELLEVDFELPR